MGDETLTTTQYIGHVAFMYDRQQLHFMFGPLTNSHSNEYYLCFSALDDHLFSQTNHFYWYFPNAWTNRLHHISRIEPGCPVNLVHHYSFTLWRYATGRNQPYTIERAICGNHIICILQIAICMCKCNVLVFTKMLRAPWELKSNGAIRLPWHTSLYMVNSVSRSLQA